MLAPDPVKRSLNPYPYCDNDPVNYNDPTGEIPTILAGGLLGGLFGGASGFLGSTISQVTSGEEFNWRKALGAGANGAVVGAARGALIGSGAGIPAAFATDFLAGASGNALEQWITKERADRIDIGESLVSGTSNAFGQMLYGTGQLKGLGDAFIRGARSGAAVSGLENIAGALGLTGRDPRRMCGSPDPFDLESGLGGSEGYHSQRGNRGGFSLGSFVKDTLTGAVAGGLGSAGFYGAGKAVEALRGSVGTPRIKTLYHYTNEKGMNGITESNQLNPSLKANNPKDARYGDGQYLSDIKPNMQTPASLAKKFINVPNKYKYTHYVQINVTGLEVIQGRQGVFVIPNNSPLDLTGRIISVGTVGGH